LAPPRKRRLPARFVLALGTALLAASLLAAPAAANVISPEPAHSPNASDTNTLYWIGLIASLLLIVVVNGALILAVTRYRARRGVEPRRLTGRRRIQLRVTGLLALFFAALFVVTVIYTEKVRQVPPTGPAGLQTASATTAQGGGGKNSAEPLQIKTTGQQWLWRYQYPNGAFSYYRLVVPVDTTVKLDLDSTDVTHSWYVPELGGKFEAVPGHSNEAFFRADQTGDYFGRSAQFSGQGYAAMRTEVSVVTPDQYTAYIKQLKSDIQSAQDRVVALIQANGGPPGSPSTASPPADSGASAAQQSPGALPGPTSKQAQSGKQPGAKKAPKKQAKGKPQQSGGGGK
jgi:cytochrome c oxidase subunit II